MALLAILSIPSILALVGIGIVITRDTWVGGRNWKP